MIVRGVIDRVLYGLGFPANSELNWLIGEYSKGGRGGDNEQEGHTGFLVLLFAVPPLLVVPPLYHMLKFVGGLWSDLS